MTQLQQTRRGWFRRNWKWVVPLGCLTPILLCGGVLALVISLAFGMIKASDPYQQGLAAAQNNPAVISRLGSPISAGLLTSGSIHVSGPAGDADIAIPISGPKGKATLYVVGKKSGGVWTYSTLRVTVDHTSEEIDLTAAGPE